MGINLELNYNVLLNRKNHELFRVVKGKLVKIETFCDKLYYLFRRSVVQRQVKTVINAVVQQYQKNDLKTFYFKKVCRLSEKIFDRTIIPEIDQLSKTIKESDSDLKEVKLALKLGVGCEMTSEGNSGSYYLMNIKGDRKYVFKPHDESSLSGNTPKLKGKIIAMFKKILPLLDRHNNILGHEASKSEVRACVLDKQLGLNIVPKTVEATFQARIFRWKKKGGSSQKFIHGAVSSKVGTKDVTPEQFKKLVILDFLIGNQDRHSDNWLVKEKSIVAIDNGLSFPEKYYNGWFDGFSHVYAWKYHEQAKLPFDPSDIQYCQKIDYSTLHLNPKQEKLMRERQAILQKAIEMGKPMKYLGNVRTQIDVKRVKKELSIS